MASIFTRFLTNLRPKEEVKEITFRVDSVGSSGTEIYAGYIHEEYLDALRSDKAAEVYDKMRRSDTQIKMVLSAVKNPIRSAKWYVECEDEDPKQQYIKEFVNHVIFNDLGKTWRKFMTEALTMIDYGFAPFEVTHKVVKDHSDFGTYIGFKSLGWRSPKTITRFFTNDAGQLLGIAQEAYGDLQRLVTIPAEHLYFFSLDSEGDNYEGVSMLRSCYGAWLRKQAYLKLMAIGIEKTAVPTPIGTVPTGKENTPEFAVFQEVLQKYMSHQSQYITKPEGWTIEFNQNTFDADKVVKAVEIEDKAIVKSFLANFLELGMSGSGSYALSFDQSDFFLGGITHIADSICEIFNTQIIPDLVKINFGEQAKYPTLKYGGIQDRAGQELANVIKTLVDGNVILADQKLEEHVRKQYDLPEASVETSRAKTEPSPFQRFAEKTKSVELSESGHRHFRLSEASSDIQKFTEGLSTLMEEGLAQIGEKLIDSIIQKYQSVPDSQNLNVIDKVSPTGLQAYKNRIEEILILTAVEAYKKAQREVKSDSSIKFADEIPSKVKALYKKLPKGVRKRIDIQTDLLLDSQVADMQKAIYFQYTSSVTSTDSAKLLKKDLKDSLAKYISSSSVTAAAGNSAAQIVNEARKEYFFSDDVIDQVESFEFVNEDPISEICQSLEGKVLSVDDPDLDRYWTPLHHNAVLPGTLIKTANGEFPIEQIKVGDLVMTHSGQYRPVTEFMDRFEDKHYFEIQLDNGKKIEITAEHPVLTARGWLRVDQLTLDDDVVCVEDIAVAK